MSSQNESALVLSQKNICTIPTENTKNTNETIDSNSSKPMLISFQCEPANILTVKETVVNHVKHDSILDNSMKITISNETIAMHVQDNETTGSIHNESAVKFAQEKSVTMPIDNESMSIVIRNSEQTVLTRNDTTGKVSRNEPAVETHAQNNEGTMSTVNEAIGIKAHSEPATMQMMMHAQNSDDNLSTLYDTNGTKAYNEPSILINVQNNDQTVSITNEATKIQAHNEPVSKSIENEPILVSNECCETVSSSLNEPNESLSLSIQDEPTTMSIDHDEATIQNDFKSNLLGCNSAQNEIPTNLVYTKDSSLSSHVNNPLHRPTSNLWANKNLTNKTYVELHLNNGNNEMNAMIMESNDRVNLQVEKKLNEPKNDVNFSLVSYDLSSSDESNADCGNLDESEPTEQSLVINLRTNDKTAKDKDQSDFSLRNKSVVNTISFQDHRHQPQSEKQSESIRLPKYANNALKNNREIEASGSKISEEDSLLLELQAIYSTAIAPSSPSESDSSDCVEVIPNPSTNFRETETLVVSSDSDDESGSTYDSEVDPEISQNEQDDTMLSDTEDAQLVTETLRKRELLLKRKSIRTTGEVFPEELAPLKTLNVSTVEDVEMQQLGSISGIVETLVIVESRENSPCLYDDTVLFLEEKKPLGLIFEVFGNVGKPFFSVRFNSSEDIEASGVKIGDTVYFAPKADNLTKYVFLKELQKMKFNDASWEDDNEIPLKHRDFSDDEDEKRSKSKRRFNLNKDSSEKSPHFKKKRGTSRNQNGFALRQGNLMRNPFGFAPRGPRPDSMRPRGPPNGYFPRHNYRGCSGFGERFPPFTDCPPFMHPPRFPPYPGMPNHSNFFPPPFPPGPFSYYCGPPRHFPQPNSSPFNSPCPSPSLAPPSPFSLTLPPPPPPSTTATSIDKSQTTNSNSDVLPTSLIPLPTSSPQIPVGGSSKTDFSVPSSFIGPSLP